jgi:hypothetical protein
MNRGIFLAVIGVLVLLAILVFSCVEVVPPNIITKGRISVTEQRIRLFWEKNGKLPTSLAGLPLLPGRENKTTDAWGTELGYKVQGNTVTLWSPGKPGVAAPTVRERGFTNTFDVTKPLVPSP